MFTLLFNKVAKATEEDLYLARIPANRRDYCGHLLIDLQRCKRENFPFMGKCEHFSHEWNECQNQEYKHSIFYF
jgi:NADH dehydrogenase (ubiquinone) 1 beta subcomplex subunit 7